MKKLSSLLIIVILLMSSLVGCSKADSIEKDNEVGFYLETPVFITNGITQFDILDEGEMLLPIKNWEVVETNSDKVELELVKPINTEDLKKIKDNKFKYNNLEKYSLVKYKFKTDKIEQKYSSYFTTEFWGKFKLEFYEDELKDDFKNQIENNNVLASRKKLIGYRFLDYYSGDYATYSTDMSKEKEKFKNKDEKYIIAENLNGIEDDLYNKFIKNNSEFEKVAKEISKNFKSQSDEDKAHAIYEYITKNIKWDKTRLDNFNLDGNKENIKKYFSINKVLETKTGTCIDLVYLFNALAKYHNLNVGINIGRSVYGDEQSFHAWNVVAAENDKVIFIDSTFGIKDFENNFIVVNKGMYLDVEFFKEHLVWNKETKSYTPFKAN
jgi:hypothetical protein